MRLAVDRQLVDLRPGQTEQTRQQRDGSQHGDNHDECDRDAHGGDGRQSGEKQAEDGDDHGSAGEQHCLTGCAVGRSGRVLHTHAFVQMLAVAGDDEQRVVDADPEAHHHAEDQGELRDVDEGRQDADAGDADEQAHERRDDWEPHGDHRAEGDQENDDRNAHADELAARSRLHDLSKEAGELSLNASGASGSRRRLRVVEVGHGELCRRVRHVDVRRGAARTDRSGLRCERIGHAGDVLPGRQPPAGLLDGRAVPGIVEPAITRVEHDASGLTTLSGKPGRQDVGRFLRLDSGDTEAVIELSAEAALQRHDGERGHEPDAEHPERVAGAAATEAVQESTHGLSSWVGPQGAGPLEHPGAVSMGWSS